MCGKIVVLKVPRKHAWWRPGVQLAAWNVNEDLSITDIFL